MKLRPELFEEIVEYTKHRARWSSGGSGDEDLVEDHPIVAFCNDLLGDLSAEFLTMPLDGFNARTQEVLVLERRRLERQGASTKALQAVLYELEAAAPVLGVAGYAHSEEAVFEFVEEHFHPLLQALVTWLDDECGDEEPALAAGGALIQVEATFGLRGTAP